jgi:hypothetical protein
VLHRLLGDVASGLFFSRMHCGLLGLWLVDGQIWLNHPSAAVVVGGESRSRNQRSWGAAPIDG